MVCSVVSELTCYAMEVTWVNSGEGGDTLGGLAAMGSLVGPGMGLGAGLRADWGAV